MYALHINRSLTPYLRSATPRLVRNLKLCTTPLPVPHIDPPALVRDHKTFVHPDFNKEDCLKIEYEHRPPKSLGDRIALLWIKFFRSSFDLVSGYKKLPTGADTSVLNGTRYEMNEQKWLIRCIFLESVAGVPGAVAGFLRHLHSIRLLRGDQAWVETLLDEAYNERMHLLLFIQMGQPGLFMRACIYGAQGVFCNLFFLAYLMNPRYCHRFVGYLEEEAVSTYSHFLKDLESGRLQQFDKMKLPKVATDYWPNLDSNLTMKDFVLQVRADEAKHREVNHTLANLSQKADPNPFTYHNPQCDKPQPEHGIKVTRGVGWEPQDLSLR